MKTWKVNEIDIKTNVECVLVLLVIIGLGTRCERDGDPIGLRLMLA
jgi:hypothetical protein